MATVIVSLIVASALFLAARQLYKDKKSGDHPAAGIVQGARTAVIAAVM